MSLGNLGACSQKCLRIALVLLPLFLASPGGSLLAPGRAAAMGETSGATKPHPSEATFPCPAGLESLVDFWIEIFTRHDGDWSVIHDEIDPGIRYETVSTAGMTEKMRKDFLRERRVHFVKILENLALKSPERRTDEEARVAALFPPGTGATRFLEAASDVRSQRGIRDQFLAGVKRSGKWKPTIEGILAGYGIPKELAALPHIESSYRPDALSKAGALGVWQFTTGTGRRFMRIDRHVDERRDVYCATHAAAQYLKEAYGRLQSWPLTVTSYNHGVEGMLRAQREVGSNDITRLIDEYEGPYFGFASKNFYAEFLAALRVLDNLEAHFGPVEMEPLENIERFVLPGPVRVPSLATAFNISPEELQALNPAFGERIWKGTVSAPAGSIVNVPRGRVNDLAAAFADIPAMDRVTLMDAGGQYKVRSGDTLGSIARRHGVSVASLQALNGLGESTKIRAGQRLSIPDKNQ